MVKENLKLFATDMDGTFLRNDRTFDHERLRNILKSFDTLGYIFCAASGRQLLALEKIFAEFRDQMAFVAENGGLVKYKGQVLFEKKLTKEQLSDLVNILCSNPYASGDMLLLSGQNASYVLVTTDDSYYEKCLLYYENVKKVHSVLEVDDDIFKITTHFPHDHIQRCKDWLSQRASYVRATTAGFEATDIVPIGINKAVGLENLTTSLNLTADNVIAFGDQMNDYEMLRYAGRSVAVANAVDKIKMVADYEIASSDEESVLGEIEKIIGGTHENCN